MLRSLVGLVMGTCVLLAVGVAQAQCTKDTDCKGDRVCDGGSCVAPSNAPAPAGTPAAVPPAAVAPTAVAPAAVAPPVAPAPVAPVPVVAAPARDPAPELPRRRRHSTGMMVGGIIMVSFSPIALIAAGVANAQQTTCEAGGYYLGSNGISTYDYDNCSAYDKTIYGGLILGLGLLGAGIPLIVIGGKKVPAEPTATLTPWATQSAAGLGLRLEM
jgi:hypothetical protein